MALARLIRFVRSFLLPVFAVGACLVASAAQAQPTVSKVVTPATTLDGETRSGGHARGTPTVSAAPTLAKEFTDDPVAPGGTVTLEFTLEHPTDATADATGISFTDDLSFLTGLTANLPPSPDPPCRPGSSLTASAGDTLLTLMGGSLSPGESCTFRVTLAVPAGAAPGSYTNTTSDVSANVDGSQATSPPASDQLTVANLDFNKKFLGDPVVPGDTVVLRFTIENISLADNATQISFTDDLDAVISGLTATSLPALPCGAGSSITGVSFLTFSGGELPPMGGTCSFDVEVLIPASAMPGTYINSTSDLFQAGLPVADPATAGLVVEPPPTFAKTFVPDFIGIGQTSTLVFTIDNTASALAATALDFTDNLPAGVVVATSPNASTTCTGGTITAVAATGTISYSGGSVGAGASCTVQADATATTLGVFVNTSGDLTSSSGNSGTATDTLTVVGPIDFTKTFQSSPVLPGGLVDLEFTITNPSSDQAITDLSFSDDLDAALAGLMAVGLPMSDVCGPGSQLSGSSVITLSGGNLGAGASCTFTVSVRVPADAPEETFTNVTSPISGDIGGGSISGAPASDDFSVAFLTFEKAFTDTVVTGGGTTGLVFTITNPDPVNTATSITFTDDLEAVLMGLMAVDVPQSDVCGVGSELDGASLLTLTGGSLAGGESCTFMVALQLPSDAPDGEIMNVTSPLDANVGGQAVSGGPASVATASIVVSANVLAIPTLGEWGLALLAAMLALFGAAQVRRCV